MLHVSLEGALAVLRGGNSLPVTSAELAPLDAMFAETRREACHTYGPLFEALLVEDKWRTGRGLAAVAQDTVAGTNHYWQAIDKSCYDLHSTVFSRQKKTADVNNNW